MDGSDQRQKDKIEEVKGRIYLALNSASNLSNQKHCFTHTALIENELQQEVMIYLESLSTSTKFRFPRGFEPIGNMY